VVIVHDAELLTEANNATSTAAGKFSLETVNKIVGVDLGGLGSSNGVLAEEVGRELSVVN